MSAGFGSASAQMIVSYVIRQCCAYFTYPQSLFPSLVVFTLWVKGSRLWISAESRSTNHIPLNSLSASVMSFGLCEKASERRGGITQIQQAVQGSSLNIKET